MSLDINLYTDINIGIFSSWYKKYFQVALELTVYKKGYKKHKVSFW